MDHQSRVYKGGLITTQLLSPRQCLLTEHLESTAGLSAVVGVSVQEKHPQDVSPGSELPGWAPGPCPLGQGTLDKRIIKVTPLTSAWSSHRVNGPMGGGRAETLALTLTSHVTLDKSHPFPGSGDSCPQNDPAHSVGKREEDQIHLRDCCIVSAPYLATMLWSAPLCSASKMVGKLSFRRAEERLWCYVVAVPVVVL